MSLKGIFQNCTIVKPGVEACVYPGEYRVEAKPLLRESPEVDLSLIYGEWFELTQIPPNTSIVITDGRESYSAYVRNSPATVVVKVNDAGYYAMWLARTLEEIGLGHLVDQETVAKLEEENKVKAKKYDPEAIRKKVELLAERAKPAAPQAEAGPGVLEHVAEPQLERHAKSAVDALEDAAPPSLGTWRVEAAAGGAAGRRGELVETTPAGRVDLCSELEARLRQINLSVELLLGLLEDEEFRRLLAKYAARKVFA